jgi:hypothetical protein
MTWTFHILEVILSHIMSLDFSDDNSSKVEIKLRGARTNRQRTSNLLKEIGTRVVTNARARQTLAAREVDSLLNMIPFSI